LSDGFANFALIAMALRGGGGEMRNWQGERDFGDGECGPDHHQKFRSSIPLKILEKKLAGEDPLDPLIMNEWKIHCHRFVKIDYD
jgi:hypothetical protein